MIGLKISIMLKSFYVCKEIMEKKTTLDMDKRRMASFIATNQLYCIIRLGASKQSLNQSRLIYDKILLASVPLLQTKKKERLQISQKLPPTHVHPSLHFHILDSIYYCKPCNNGKWLAKWTKCMKFRQHEIGPAKIFQINV